MKFFNSFGALARGPRQSLLARPLARRALAGLALACGALALSVQPAAAQVTYQYTGNPFSLFSCGGNSDCSTPGPNANTSYTAADIVTGTLTLSSPLPPNLALQDISGLPGFQIVLKDGHQTMTATAGYTGGFLAKVSTDATGSITGWALVVNCCFYPNNGIATANDPGGSGVFDQGTLSAASPNNGYPNTPYNLALNFGKPGTWGGGPSGTATRTIMTGSAFGLPDTPVDLINGGDGKVNTSSWNFIIPSGWSYARGSVVQGGLQAGAYSATSGPCGPNAGTCGVGAGRGVAYRSWSNTSSSSLTFQVNAVLDGEFQNSGGVASAGVYVFDTTSFVTQLATSGLAPPQFLLNSSTIGALGVGGSSLSLALLFPSSGVLLNDFRTVTGPPNQLLTIPFTTTFVTLAPQQSITVMFDVSAYAPGFGSVNFASTLAPSPTLPLFTDAAGNAVTQLVAIGPSTPASVAPVSLLLTPPTASNPAGTTASITATVKDSGGNPIPNAIVFFAFNAGPNAGPAGPVSTDTNGQAVFTYTDNGGAGTDVIQATLGTLTATPVSLTWTAPGPLDHIAISPATAGIVAGASQLYSATGFDRFNNTIGDVTAQTTFSIAPDGSCTGASCTASLSGLHTVTAHDGGKTAQANLTVTGGKTTPIITWLTPSAITFGTPLTGTQLNATASVAGTFIYNPKAGTILTAGSHTLTLSFTPTNTSSYSTATATVTLQVNKATPLVVWLPVPIVYGTPLGLLQLDALTLVPGKFTFTPPCGTVLPAGQQTLSATFTPSDTTDFATVTLHATLLVVKALPITTWPAPASITVGTPLGSVQLNAKANIPGRFVYNPPPGTKLAAGTYELNATFTPTDSADYQGLTTEARLTVKSH